MVATPVIALFVRVAGLLITRWALGVKLILPRGLLDPPLTEGGTNRDNTISTAGRG